MEYEDDYFFEDEEDGMDMFDYFDEEEITPEMEDLLESIRSGRRPSPVEYARISVSELMENCLVPTSHQMAQGLVTLLIMSLIFRLITQIRRSAAAEGSIPAWMIHFASAVFGIMVLRSVFELAFLYMVVCCSLSYLLLIVLAPKGRYLSGVASSMLIVLYVIFCELWLVDPTTWHRIRGAQMILSMKIISVAFDYGSGAIIDLPNMAEYVGYCFHVGTVIFGPWISYQDYFRGLLTDILPLSWRWLWKCLSRFCLSTLCLLYSTCITHWLILDHAWIWLLAFRDAQSFRFSHYFVSFMSEATAVLSGAGKTREDGEISWSLTVSKPHLIELPRSLVEVVINWNLPMHYWLKTYVFKSARPYGTFTAVIFTYAASSLLHGLNFQLAAVLLSLGLYSYVEFVFRAKLSKIFSACIQAKRCKATCDHQFKFQHPLVMVTNLIFLGLSMLHLAYLGLMFDSSTHEEEGYTMEHTLTKWYDLSFLSHKIVLGTYIVHLLI